ncbi:MAG: ribose 5-phosphate isomerase A [Candidatus Thermoplasmatota archaeon]|nr:ribose 5-phosphate isomerase A [Candidatus Thermoplasmatota archaeon]
MNQDTAKFNAAEEAVKLIKNGMIVGLGTGSTAKIAVDLIGQKLSENFQIIGMPTSIKTKNQAESLGIKLIGIDDANKIDIAIDGADEVSPDLSLIKGLGGALLREKKVEKKANELIIIVDESKMVEKLGVGFLPVEVYVDNHEETKVELSELGCTTELRIEDNNLPFITDNENYIYHCKFEKGIDNPKELDKQLMKINGVVDTGLFIDMTTKVIVGTPDGTKIID